MHRVRITDSRATCTNPHGKFQLQTSSRPHPVPPTIPKYPNHKSPHKYAMHIYLVQIKAPRRLFPYTALPESRVRHFSRKFQIRSVWNTRCAVSARSQSATWSQGSFEYMFPARGFGNVVRVVLRGIWAYVLQIDAVGLVGSIECPEV